MTGRTTQTYDSRAKANVNRKPQNTFFLELNEPARPCGGPARVVQAAGEAGAEQRGADRWTRQNGGRSGEATDDEPAGFSSGGICEPTVEHSPLCTGEAKCSRGDRHEGTGLI